MIAFLRLWSEFLGESEQIRSKGAHRDQNKPESSEVNEWYTVCLVTICPRMRFVFVSSLLSFRSFVAFHNF